MGAGCIVLAALAAYYNSFGGPFILDDFSAIRDNPSIRHLWALRDVLSPPALTTANGRPLLNLSFALNYAWNGLDPWSYHALSLLIHILAAWTIFGLVRRTLARLPAPAVNQRAFGLALVSALLWTIHPLTTEAVTYISERAESLMGLFYLLTVYCFIRYADGRRIWGWLAFGSCLLGMLSKEDMVTAPVMVFLYDRTFVSGTLREAWRKHKGLHLAIAGTWLVTVFQMHKLATPGVNFFATGVTWWAYGLTECRVLIQYLKLSIWPHPLVFNFGLSILDTRVLDTAPFVLAIALLLAAIVAALKYRPVLGFAGAWFFVILAPTSSILPIAAQPMGEHRTYLSLLAVVVPAVLAAYVWLGRRRSLVLFGFAALALAALTIRRNEDYRSALVFYQDMVLKTPGNFFARFNLGKALQDACDLPEAIDQFQTAIRIEPDEARLYQGLADALAQEGRDEEAAAQYQEALRRDPNSPGPYAGLGNLLFKADRVSDAADAYRAALRLDPENAAICVNLGLAESRLRQFPQAAEAYRKALSLGADFPQVHAAFGSALAALGRLTEAADQLQLALKENPDDTEARQNYAQVLAMLGQPGMGSGAGASP